MSKKSVVFIDSRVADYQTIVAALPVGTDWYLLNPTSNGVSQIQSILANYSGLDSIHIFSHGSVGAIQIGSGELSSQNITDYIGQWSVISSRFTDAGNGYIALYGSNVAQGYIGQEFVQSLYECTGLSVFASTDVTGTAAFGGNWFLEAKRGPWWPFGETYKIDNLNSLLNSTEGIIMTDSSNQSIIPRLSSISLGELVSS